MKLPGFPFVVLDTETTGFVPKVHRVMEFASMGVEKGEVVDTYEALFAAKDIPPVVQVLTRIRPEALAGKKMIEEHQKEIFDHVPEGALLVGQNLAFDLGMLKGHGFDFSGRPWIDTSLLASLVFPELQSYSLGYLSRVLNLDHSPQHRALGDVRATLELLSAVWERLLELPTDMLEEAKEVMSRAPEGYRKLFEALPASKKRERPEWMKSRGRGSPKDAVETFELPEAEKGSVTLLEEPLSPSFVERLVASANGEKESNWFAVKNMDAFLRRSGLALEGKTHRVLWSAYQILDQDSAKALAEQKEFTAEEATLLLKIMWLAPKVRSEMPVHGGEEPVWNGKLASTKKSKAYRDQFSKLPPVAILDHRELLGILTNEEHPGHAVLAKGNVRVTVDDASMLEDTATKAYGWECNTESLRAAAAGNSELTQITDLLQLWMEKTRFGQDVRYLTISDLQSPEAQGLRKQIEKFSGTLTEQAEQLLHDARNILDSDNLTHRIAWIELWQNGTLVLSSVPERIGMLLKKDLFDQAATTLLIPQGSANHLPEILPPGGGAKTKLISHNEKIDLPLTIDTELPLETILSTPPEGKTILLVPSRSLAESLYVQNLEKFEAMGGTLICQGVSGGQGRMQAEFLAAKSPVIWIQTPFSFEGIDLPAGSIDRLILKALPFDHPSHTILSRRAQNYGNAFEDYLLPRLQHRLFRILRAFCRMRAEGAGVTVLDDRLEKKEYGQRLTRYLLLISGNSDLPADTAVPRTAKPKSAPKVTKETSAKKPRKKKASDTQLPLL